MRKLAQSRFDATTGFLSQAQETMATVKSEHARVMEDLQAQAAEVGGRSGSFVQNSGRCLFGWLVTTRSSCPDCLNVLGVDLDLHARPSCPCICPGARM